MIEPVTHVMIPDTQAKAGVKLAHHSWIGNYIVDHCHGKETVVIGIGDHADMPSLSSYDKGTGKMEGRRYVKDIDAANEAWNLLNAPIAAEVRRTAKLKTPWKPRLVKLRGNHEDRITRAANQNAQLDGLVTLDDLDDCGWETFDYLVPVTIDGIIYSHFFANPMTGRPYGGATLEARIKTIGHSFTMGHQQGLKWARVETLEGPHIGLVAGSCYLHDEDYLGPQGNAQWKGIVVCHQVENGSYDPMMISLDFLCRKYEGVRLSSFMTRHYRR
jgi:hypothetical protein